MSIPNEGIFPFSRLSTTNYGDKRIFYQHSMQNLGFECTMEIFLILNSNSQKSLYSFIRVIRCTYTYRENGNVPPPLMLLNKNMK